jgi:hypothetical protein
VIREKLDSYSRNCGTFNVNLRKYTINSDQTQQALFKFVKASFKQVPGGKFWLNGKRDEKGNWVDPQTNEPLFKGLNFRSKQKGDSKCKHLVLTLDANPFIDCATNKNSFYLICEYDRNVIETSAQQSENEDD